MLLGGFGVLLVDGRALVTAGGDGMGLAGLPGFGMFGSGLFRVGCSLVGWACWAGAVVVGGGST